MKNAHKRFGRLLYRRQTEKTATNLRVFLDAFVGEEQGKAHLVSVVGGDVEIGALAAAKRGLIHGHGSLWQREHCVLGREAVVLPRLNYDIRP